MEEQTIVEKQEESVKISRGMTGKSSYEFKLIGKVENNIERVKELQKELDNIIKKEE